MNRRPGYSKAIRERVVQLVLTNEHDNPSYWAATQSIASKITCAPEILHTWVEAMEVDSSAYFGITTDQYQRTKEIEREVRELKRTNEILR